MLCEVNVPATALQHFQDDISRARAIVYPFWSTSAPGMSDRTGFCSFRF
jgi:hypothetical protein